MQQLAEVPYSFWHLYCNDRDTHLLEALEHLLVAELAVAQDGAARLDWLDDLGAANEVGHMKAQLNRHPGAVAYISGMIFATHA